MLPNYDKVLYCLVYRILYNPRLPSSPVPVMIRVPFLLEFSVILIRRTQNKRTKGYYWETRPKPETIQHPKTQNKFWNHERRQSTFLVKLGP